MMQLKERGFFNGLLLGMTLSLIAGLLVVYLLTVLGIISVAVLEIPRIAQPKPKRHRLSTGQQPVQLVQVEGGWAMRCFGCGTTSPPASFKWQALDRTVQCACTDW